MEDLGITKVMGLDSIKINGKAPTHNFKIIIKLSGKDICFWLVLCFHS
jgi:hypothetical protein